MDAHDGGRARFCQECQKTVHDVSRYTRREMADLLEQSGGRLCGRLTRGPAGEVLFREEPSRWALLARRWPKLTTALASLTLVASAQETAQRPPLTHIEGAGTATASGRVTDEAGQGLEGVRVTLLSVRGYPFSRVTDAEGRFTVGLVPSGTYRVLLEMPGQPAVERGVVRLEPGQDWRAEEALGPAGAEETRRKESSTERVGMASLSGVVFDASGAVIPNARVTLTGPTPAKAVTGVDGHFVLRDLPSGKYTVGIEMEGFRSHQQSQTLASGEAAALKVELQVGAEVMVGMVVMADSSPALLKPVSKLKRLFKR